MKAFKCRSCGKVSFSSADLNSQTSPGCSYCRADKKHMTEETTENCDSCVCCGVYIPEGRMVCIQCEGNPYHALEEKGGAS